MSYNLIDIHMHPLHPVYMDYISRTLKLWEDKCECFPWSEDKMRKFMNDTGIDLGFMSISSPCIHSGNDAEAKKVVRDANISVADMVNRNKNMKLMACLPLPDVGAAIEEVRFAYDELHVAGISMVTNYNGLYMGHPALDPLYKLLNHYGAIVFIHPCCPSAVPKGVLDDMPIPMLEFMFDTTRSLANIIRSGVLERFPDIRFIIPHCGGTLPWLMDRLVNGRSFSKMPANSFDLFKKIYFDVAGGSMPRQLKVLLELVPEDHILFGSDYNWFNAEQTNGKLKAIKNAPYLSDDAIEGILHRNAEKLFKLQ